MFPVEAFQNTLGKVVKILDGLEIRFHLTGGITSVLYGEPRLTQDINIVVDPRALTEQCERFLEEISDSDFLFDATAVKTAISRQGMFQLFDTVEALKLDLYPRELISGELDRLSRVEIFRGVLLPVVSKMDAAAAKLIWISKGSHKSRRDLRQIHRSASVSERQTLFLQAEQLGLSDLLKEVLNESEEIE